MHATDVGCMNVSNHYTGRVTVVAYEPVTNPLSWKLIVYDRRAVKIGAGNGLLPDNTKPLPEPMSIYHQGGPSGIHLTVISHKYM